jgi:hypothetical protein
MPYSAHGWLHNPPGPVSYWCYSGANPAPLYLIRTHGGPLRMVEAIRRKIHEIEPWWNRCKYFATSEEERLPKAK